MRAANPAAADLPTVSACLAPEQIPYELLILGAPELGRPLAGALAGANEDESVLWELLAVLDEYLLIQRDPGTKSYSVHRLVQEMIRAPRTKRGKGVGLAPAERRTWANRAVRGLDRAFPLARPETWPLCERLLPHALAGGRWIETEGLESKGAELLLSQTGHYLRARGQHTAAEPLLQRALAISEALMGPKDPSTAYRLTSLAELYHQQGRLTAAEPLYERALAIHWQAHGPEHPHTANSLNRLAGLYYAQGKLAEAEPPYERALAIFERALGPEHSHSVTCRENLASLQAEIERQ